MKKTDRAPKVEVVSEGPPVRSLAEILRNPPTLELVGGPVRTSDPRAMKPRQNR